MTPALSVLEKAQDLQAAAGRLLEGAAGQQEADRVRARVAEVSAELDHLDRVIGVARKLAAVGCLPVVDIGSAAEGLAGFGRQADKGLPSNQSFKTAQAKIKAVAVQIGSRVTEVWSTWSGQEIAELPTTRIVTLSVEAQEGARGRHAELVKLAKMALPAAADIAMFVTTLGLLRERLANASDAPAELAELLQRIDQRPAMTLADVTAEQLALLQATTIAGNIELRRRTR